MSIIAPGSMVETLLFHDRASAWWGLDTADPLADDGAFATAALLVGGFRLTASGTPTNAATLHRAAADSGASGSRDFNGTNQAYTTPDQVLTAAPGPPALHAVRSSQVTSATGTVLGPGGVLAGDLLIFIATHPTAGATVSSAPSGFTLVGTALNCTTHTKAVYRRTADASDTTPQQYSITWNSSAAINTVVLVVRGCDPGVANLVFDSGEVATPTDNTHNSTVENYPEAAWQVIVATSKYPSVPQLNPPGRITWHQSANGQLSTIVAAYKQMVAGSGNQLAVTEINTNLGMTTLTFGSPKQVVKSLRNLNFPLTICCLLNGDSFATTNRSWLTKDSVINCDVTTAGVLRYQYFDGSLRTHTGPTLSTGVTYRIWIRDDGTNVSFFVNGQKTTVARASSNAINVLAGQFSIGASSTAGVLGAWFDGRIDEVAIFQVALSDQQINTHERAAVDGTVGQFITADQSGRFPRAKMEIAFNSNPTDVSYVFSDVTNDVRVANGIATSFGRNSELDRMQAGTMSFVLNNRQRQYDNILPARVVRFMAQSGVDAPVFLRFFGFTDSPKFNRPANGLDSTVSVTATDLFKALAIDKIRNTLVRPTELPIYRILAVLAQVPGLRMGLDAGHHNIIGADLQGQGRLEHIQQVAETDGGIVWATPEGAIQFEDNEHRSTDFKSTAVQATYGWFGTSAASAATSFEPEVDETRLFTAAMVTPASGAVQTAVNSTAAAQFFERTVEKTTLHASENDAAAMAKHYANAYGQPLVRVPALRIQPAYSANPPAAWLVAFHHRPSNRIKTIENPPGGSEVAREHFVEGVADYVDANRWLIDLQLSPTELEGKLFVIGVDAIGSTKTIGW